MHLHTRMANFLGCSNRSKSAGPKLSPRRQLVSGRLCYGQIVRASIRKQSLSFVNTLDAPLSLHSPRPTLKTKKQRKTRKRLVWRFFCSFLSALPPIDFRLACLFFHVDLLAAGLRTACFSICRRSVCSFRTMISLLMWNHKFLEDFDWSFKRTWLFRKVFSPVFVCCLLFRCFFGLPILLFWFRFFACKLPTGLKSVGCERLEWVG